MGRKRNKDRKKIKSAQKVYSTKELDITMENVVNRINTKIAEIERELTDEEKNEIIIQCYKEKFLL